MGKMYYMPIFFLIVVFFFYNCYEKMIKDSIDCKIEKVISTLSMRPFNLFYGYCSFCGLLMWIGSPVFDSVLFSLHVPSPIVLQIMFFFLKRRSRSFFDFTPRQQLFSIFLSIPLFFGLLKFFMSTIKNMNCFFFLESFTALHHFIKLPFFLLMDILNL